MSMSVRILNAVSTAAGYAAPGRAAILNATAGYQDVAPADAQWLASQGFVAVAYAGKTTERPTTLPDTPLGLRCFIDTDLNRVVAKNQQGQWGRYPDRRRRVK
jgi:hypothetical protein